MTYTRNMVGIIKQWLYQTCIGYQHTDEGRKSVYWGQIEMESGEIQEVWFLGWTVQPGNYEAASGLLFHAPHIDTVVIEGEV